MNVLHVVTSGEVAGGQIVCFQLIDYLLRSGHQACVVSPSEGPFTEQLRTNRIPYFIIPFEKTYSVHRAFQLMRLIQREKVDVVHTHGMVALNILSRLAARLAHVPCLSHIHIENMFHPNPFIRSYQVWLDNWTSRFCEHLIAVSHATKEALIKQGIASSRIVVLPNGVDCKEVKSRKSREDVLKGFHVDSQQKVIGTVGRLCPTKGQEEFLRAAQSVSLEVKDVVWMVVGRDIEFGGRYEARLRDLANDLGLNGSVVFTGYQSDVFSLVNAFDFLVLPSKIEGMPLVILEAMALKKAVIATRVGGVPEVIEDGKTGILVPPGDRQCLIQAMLKLIRNPELARAMSEEGFARVQSYFSQSKTCHRIMELYRDFLRAKI